MNKYQVSVTSHNDVWSNYKYNSSLGLRNFFSIHIQLQLCGGKGSFLTLNTKLQSHWAFGVGFPDSGFEANSEKEILIFD